jgi:hypothetical protein
MYCPACNTDNDKDARTCSCCGAELKPSRVVRNGRGRCPTGPLSPLTEANHRAALRAYHVSVAALTPGLGLVLGPIAMVLGALARPGCQSDPDFSLHGPLRASLLLGAAITFCNWLGFALMYLGLRSAGMF